MLETSDVGERAVRLAAKSLRRDISRISRLILLRLRFVALQLLGAATIAFFLIRMVPGDPAKAIAGTAASEKVLAAIREHLGLDESLPVQFYRYIVNLIQGDFGSSITTGGSVLDDLVQRGPATLELISYTMIVSLLVGVPMGLAMARRRRRRKGKVISGYAMLSGSIPDFWLALILLFVFSFRYSIFPAPLGRLGFVDAPDRVTGFFTIDALIAGDFATMWLAFQHLALPVITLTLVYSGIIVKVANAATDEAMNAGFNDLYASAGVRTRLRNFRTARLAFPAVVTVSGITYGFLLGGAVLIETVFSWGGAGQYAVQALRGADFAALQGFVVFAAVFNVLMYLAVDIALYVVDPRLGRERSH